MKPYQKTFFTSFIVFCVMLTSHTSQTALSGSIDCFAQIAQVTGFSYDKNCSLITTAHAITSFLDTLYYRYRYKKSELYHPLYAITEKLELFEQELLREEEKILHKIKEEYKLSDTVWSQSLDDIKKIKQSYQEGMVQSYPSTTWDPAIGDIKNILVPLLHESNINPASINVVMADPEMVKNNHTTLARTVGTITIQENNHLIFENGYFPFTIVIFPSLLEQKNEIKKSICAHEIQHLSLQHSVTIIVISEYLSHYAQISKENFKQSTHFKALDQLHEAQAEIIASLKNPTVAQCLKNFRSHYYYPDYLYEKHFCQLAAIDSLWQIHDKLENIYFMKGIKNE